MYSLANQNQICAALFFICSHKNLNLTDQWCETLYVKCTHEPRCCQSYEKKRNARRICWEDESKQITVEAIYPFEDKGVHCKG